MDGSFSSNLQEETRKVRVEVESTYLQTKVSKDFRYNSSISWNLGEKKKTDMHKMFTNILLY